MLRKGVIERAKSPWASPILFAPKKDGTLGFCIDYQKFNSITIRDIYLTPKVDECIDSLRDSKIFTTLHCNSGYLQARMFEEHLDKPNLTFHTDLYRFLRILIELMNASAFFQRELDLVLSGLKRKSCLVYLEDVIFFSIPSKKISFMLRRSVLA